ncbi:MAG: TIGR02302 family protein [Alkalilacustris sp.]
MTRTPLDIAHDRLRRPLRLTWAGLLVERLARAFWPMWSLLFAALALLGFGVGVALPPGVFWALAGLWGVCFLAALGVGLWRFSWPTRADAFARLDARLPGRPLTALADRQAIGAGDAASAAVWRAHVLVMAERAAAAQAAPPDLRLASRDPYALRYVAATALAVALLFGAFSRTGDLTELAPTPLRFDAQAATSAWEAWVQPPAYTGRPSLYLNEVDRPSLQVPQGSRVTVRLYGQSGVMTLAESVSGRVAEPDDAGAPAHDFTVEQPGRIAVQGPGGRTWEVTVVADRAPSVRLREAMTREAGGSLRQTFEAQDDYGVVAGEARIALDLDRVERRYGLAVDPDPRDPIRLDLPMPLAGDRSRFTEALIDDLSEHPWANMPVTVRLTVEDALGQTGRSETREVVLPGRRFFDPAAAAVIEMRRDLLWARETAPRVRQVLRAISFDGDSEAFRSDRALAALRAVIADLDDALTGGPLSDGHRDEIAAALWEIATLIEDGDLAEAAERLRRAQERLAEAMRRGADPSEIDELMADLRDAMRDYLAERARQQPEDGDGGEGGDGERMEITGDQLQELLDRIQELMEEGRMAEAMELLQQLQQMLENMQVTQGQGGEGGPGQQALDGLGEALRDQQGLSDDTFRDLQDRFGQERGGQPGGQPGGEPGPRGEAPAPGEGGPGEDGEGLAEGDTPGDRPGDGAPGQAEGQGAGAGQGLADRQRALRDMLRDLDGMDLPGDGTAAGDATREALDEAGRAMEDAERALRDGDGPGALDRQAEAIDALREGMRALAEDLAREDGAGGEGDTAALGDDGTGGQRDPLGRDTGSSGGRFGTEDSMLPDGDVQARARELLEEIRRRSGEQDRPESERDYLRRLLERF